MKSMTLSIPGSPLRGRPTIVVVRRDLLGLELLEVGADVFLRRRQKRRRETIINGFGDGLHGGMASPQGFDDLGLTLPAMCEIAGEDRLRIVDRRAVGREQAGGPELEQALERREILAEIAAAAPVDHDAGAERDEIAGEEAAARRVPERQMIRRMSRRMEHGQ